jgi:hypothetical protein
MENRHRVLKRMYGPMGDEVTGGWKNLYDEFWFVLPIRYD